MPTHDELGQLYFCDEDGKPVGDPVNLEDVSIEEPTLENQEEALWKLLSDNMANISIVFTLIGKQFEKLFDAVFQLQKTVIHLCPNRRVQYLARFSKKYRVRKKNYRRAIRILEGLV